MRIGLMIGSDKERSRADRLAGLLDDGKAAESDGFASFWIPQVPGYLDAMTAVALLGQVTERIEIGTAVVPIQTRHPLIMAQQALTTQVACSGRFTLGLGPSHHWIISDQLGLPYDKPGACWCATISTCSTRRSPVPARLRSTTTASACTARSTSPTTSAMPVLWPRSDPRCCGSPANAPAEPSCGWPTNGRSATTWCRASRTRRTPPAAPEPASWQACLSRSARTSEVDGAREYASEVLGHADFSPNYVRLLEHGDAEDVGDTMAAGDESTVLARLRSYRDAGVTDLAVRVVPLGGTRTPAASRAAALRSSWRRWCRSSLLAHRRP